MLANIKLQVTKIGRNFTSIVSFDSWFRFAILILDFIDRTFMIFQASLVQLDLSGWTFADHPVGLDR